LEQEERMLIFKNSRVAFHSKNVEQSFSGAGTIECSRGALKKRRKSTVSFTSLQHCLYAGVWLPVGQNSTW